MTGAVRDPDEVVLDGLEAYANLSGERRDLAREFAAAYRGVKDAVRPYVPAGEACSIAFPSMVVGSVRVPCDVLNLRAGVVVAWQEGLLRKRSVVAATPRPEIRSIDAAPGTTAGTRGALLLTITGTRAVSVAVPRGDRALAAALRTALLTPPA